MEVKNGTILYFDKYNVYIKKTNELLIEIENQISKIL